MTDDITKCEVCGLNQWKALVEGWHVCFLCIAEFVKETDATIEAWNWWAAHEAGIID